MAVMRESRPKYVEDPMGYYSRSHYTNTSWTEGAPHDQATRINFRIPLKSAETIQVMLNFCVCVSFTQSVIKVSGIYNNARHWDRFSQ